MSGSDYQLRRLAEVVGGAIATDLNRAADEVYRQRVEIVRLRSLLMDMARWTVESLESSGVSWSEPSDVMLQDILRKVR